MNISYILYDKDTGEIKRMHQSPNISNPNGYCVLMVDDLMIGVENTHRVDHETLELVPK